MHCVRDFSLRQELSNGAHSKVFEGAPFDIQFVFFPVSCQQKKSLHLGKTRFIWNEAIRNNKEVFNGQFSPKLNVTFNVIVFSSRLQ